MLIRLSTAILAVQALAVYASAAPPVVDLGYATYTGNHLRNASQNEFLGIRFAAPPIGDRRFRAPQPPGSLGRQNATKFPPLCYGIGSAPNSTDSSEDCLFLSVYAPSNLGDEKVPVFLFIQGGAYSSNSNANYNASALVTSTKNKMVFVEFQYRVGPYGFLASQDVKNNGDLNAGLLDQRAVMLWVQKYIKKFGGDPSRVVIVGDSAGAGSVGMHLISYDGKANPAGQNTAPLFIGAVGISPVFGATPIALMEPLYQSFLNRTSCTSGGLTCLRRLESKTIQKGFYTTTPPGIADGSLLWGPTVDGKLITEDPYKLLSAGKFRKVPVIFGDDTDEGSVYAPDVNTAEEITNALMFQFGATEAQAALILSLYPLESYPPVALHGRYFPVASAILGEITFICPGIRLSTAFQQAGLPSWNYRYDVLTPERIANGLGSTHTSELPNLFEGIPGYMGGPPQPPDAPLVVKSLQAYYTNFVRFLDPNGPQGGRGQGSPVPVTWPVFGDSKPRLLWNLTTTSVENVPQAQLSRCVLWDTLLGRS